MRKEAIRWTFRSGTILATYDQFADQRQACELRPLYTERCSAARSHGRGHGTVYGAAATADRRQGVIDVVVVYKVDQLTRSLADFAKMVEVFDAHGVSFLAVTPQFNTTTSMGRLILNVR